MDLREKVARAIAEASGQPKDMAWQLWAAQADAAIAVMHKAHAESSAGYAHSAWVVEQAVRLMAGGNLNIGGNPLKLSVACDHVRHELARLRQDGAQ